MTPKYLEAWRNSMGITAIGSDKKTPLFKSLENDLELATEVIKRFNEHAALVAALAIANRGLVAAALCLEHPSSPNCFANNRKIVREARLEIANLTAVRGGKVVQS